MFARAGPIRDPNTLHEYEAIVPGFAKELLTSYLEESKHRRRIQSKLLDSEEQNLNQEGWLIKANHQPSIGGLIAGLVISLSALGSSVYVTVTVKGYPWIGGIIGGTTVTALAGVFVIGKLQEKQQEAKEEEEEKSAEQNEDSESSPPEK